MAGIVDLIAFNERTFKDQTYKENFTWTGQVFAFVPRAVRNRQQLCGTWEFD